ncbi:carbamoyltransferase [Alteromonas sp. LMIT006]|uniref:carbamoyltransferase family protein n=1 Tax=Alteromonadaceae TaxID=72275 RepID=UPI0020CA9967|nr:carbamoyltransferase [Alteromonas sp. LMIT006]UTP72348.1 carbamoyltransferase [Alteromonas sp. LMIT006]
MSQYVLGISAFYHDSAAAIICDGVIVAAAQEERFSRIKHDASFPSQAIAYCLAEADVLLSDCDAIVFYDKPLLKFERLLETYLAHAPRGFISFSRALPIWLKEKLYFKQLLRRECRTLAGLDKKATLPPIAFSEHHLSHAASAFYPSPFEQAVVLCLDGVGEWATTSAWIGEGQSLSPLWELHFPHSLGLLYSAFTYYCGFKVNAGEYKLMGLAPYGKPVYADIIKRHLIDIKADGSFALNLDYFDFMVGERMVNQAFCALFDGPALAHDAPLQQKHKDLAASIQQVTEEVVLAMAMHLKAQTGQTHLCLAGGVALNCVANGRLLREAGFDEIYVQPAAGDAGGALGAALEYSFQSGAITREINVLPSPQDSMQGSQLGPTFTQDDIEQACAEWGVQFRADVTAEGVAHLLTEQAVVGYFTGRMEFGPRALGHRSILGDPRDPKMQSVMNLKIKQRESFRPFAPIVMDAHVADWFCDITYSPYMLMVAQVQSDKQSVLPAITHVDGSARVQTVHSSQPVHQVLAAFYAKTGVPVLINTSFNVRGEPPVCTPSDAIRCFLATEMDYLYMDGVLLDKQAMPDAVMQRAQEVTFAKD